MRRHGLDAEHELELAPKARWALSFGFEVTYIGRILRLSGPGATLDRDGLSDWLASRYTSEQLAQRLLKLMGLRFSSLVEHHLADTLARNVCSLSEVPDFLREVEATPPGRSVTRSRGPTRRQLVRLHG